MIPAILDIARPWAGTPPEMRRVKAEGGWAVVCTEQCEIHRMLAATGVPEADAAWKAG